MLVVPHADTVAVGVRFQSECAGQDGCRFTENNRAVAIKASVRGNADDAVLHCRANFLRVRIIFGNVGVDEVEAGRKAWSDIPETALDFLCTETAADDHRGELRTGHLVAIGKCRQCLQLAGRFCHLHRRFLGLCLLLH